jgi:inosine-uridine nucleoside N-ribohydrolase
VRSNADLSRRSLLARMAALIPASAAAQNIDRATLSRLLEIPSGKRQVVIDSDTYNEIDDQYAVSYGLRSPEQMEIEAIYAAPFLNSRSTSAGDGMEKSYQEILRLLELLGRASGGFVFRGSKQFMQAAEKPVESAAAADLIDKALKPRERPLYVVTIGAPTNVASAILMEPKIKQKIVVVWLGGTPENWPSAREFNLQQDIHASRTLFDSGVALVRIPTKNVSEHLRTTLPEMERFLKGRSRLCDYLFNQFVEYYNHSTAGRPQPFPWSKVIWDISTIAWLIEPKWAPTRVAPSPILNSDFTWSQNPARHPVRVATDIRRDEIFADLFRKLAAA